MGATTAARVATAWHHEIRPRDAGRLGEVVDLLIASLCGAITVRERRIDEDHVRLLAEVDAPPIVVHRESMRIVDGAHRVEAAKRRGQAYIKARLLNGTDQDVLVEAVAANIKHGKPLTFREREAAARRLLELSPTSSDRSIATVCGLSPSTVGKQRSLVDGADVPHRVGLDGRTRRARPQRRTADRHVSTPAPAEEHGWMVVDSLLGRRVEPPKLADDVGFRSTSEGIGFAAWFDQTAVTDHDWVEHLASIPLSRTYVVADEARRRAAAWARFADLLERGITRR